MPGSKLNKLKNILRQMPSALVAFSGGVDSTFLLAVAGPLLKGNILAATAANASFPRSELRQAAALANKLGVRHRIIADNLPKEFWQNSPERCYFCKKALFAKLKRVAAQNRLRYVIDATNADDADDLRPGTKALRQLKVRSPLAEAGLSKQEIRRFSRAMGLQTWRKPAMPCLATRVAYGEKITLRKLATLAKAEEFIRRLGFSQVRVRMHEGTARIEVAKEMVPALARLHKKIARKLRSLGFIYVAIDCEGYRTGSMNEVLGWKRRR
jgi:uncharacterized protein